MSVSTWFESLFVRAFLVFVVWTMLLLGPSLAAADEPKAPKPDRPWSVEFALGGSPGGPLDDIERAMQSAGFDDPYDLWWFGEEDLLHYPFTSSDHGVAWGAARRRLDRELWSVGIGVGLTRFGTAHGHRTVEGTFDSDYWVVGSVEMTTFAPMVWYQALPALRLGFGPGLNRVETSTATSYSGEETEEWKAGLVVEAAVTAPARSRFYFLLFLQYRWMQDGTLGPLQETASNGEEVFFPETDINLSHGFIGVGLGIRF
jgi:hypothetical protein